MKILIKIPIYNFKTLSFKNFLLHLHYNINISIWLYNKIINEEFKYKGHFNCYGSVKNKALITTSNKKLYKQKGTGNSRVHMKNVPYWRGGGIVFGPLPYMFKSSMNNKDFKSVKDFMILKNYTKFIISNCNIIFKIDLIGFSIKELNLCKLILYINFKNYKILNITSLTSSDILIYRFILLIVK